MNNIEQTYKEIDSLLREASIAQIGGFRPPESRLGSWFGGRGVGLRGEQLPKYRDKDMFCLLQINISELPVVPPELSKTSLLVVFFNREELPFNQAHGDGWEIREYSSLENLEELPESKEPEMIKEFPIKWSKVQDDAPDWENAWDLVDLTAVNETDGAEERFYQYNRYSGTKIGGYPKCIQHDHDLSGFVFQIGSEEKPKWMWADNGIAYFNKNKHGVWVFECQFY